MPNQKEIFDSALSNVRAQLVELSTIHHISMVDILLSHKLFSHNEMVQYHEQYHSEQTATSASLSRESAAMLISPQAPQRTLLARNLVTGASIQVAEVDEQALWAQQQLEEVERKMSMSSTTLVHFQRTIKSKVQLGLPDVKFGVEIETLLNKRSDEFLQDTSVKAIRDIGPRLVSELGSKFNFQFFPCSAAKNDREYVAWKITTDMSIKSEDGRPIFGLEFISPKLVGSAGIGKIQTVCDALQRIGCATNNTTALHVHVSCENLTNRQIQRFCSYFVCFESVIDQFMTIPRRADYSRYCRSNLKSIVMSRNVDEAIQKIEALDVSSSINALVHLMCPRLSPVRHSHRNHKVNLLHLKNTSVGTIGRRLEFRQHQGSCDKKEVASWISFLIFFLSKTADLERPTSEMANTTKLWEIIDDSALMTYYTVKKDTLPTHVEFTYDSRELYSFEGDADDDEQASESAVHIPESTAVEESSPATNSPEVAVASPPKKLSDILVPHPPIHSPTTEIPAVSTQDMLESMLGDSFRRASSSVDQTFAFFSLQQQLSGKGGKINQSTGHFVFPVRVRLECEAFHPNLSWETLSVDSFRALIDIQRTMEENFELSDHWWITPPDRVHKKAGVRIVTPFTAEGKELGPLVGLWEETIVPEAPKQTIAYVHVSLAGFCALSSRRVIEYCLLMEDALDTILGATGGKSCRDAVRMNLTAGGKLSDLLEDLRRIHLPLQEGEKFPSNFEKLLNPSTSQTNVRNYILNLSKLSNTAKREKARAIVFRCSHITDKGPQYLVQVAGFLAYFVDYARNISDGKLLALAAEIQLLGEFSAQRLLNEISSLPQSLKLTLTQK